MKTIVSILLCQFFCHGSPCRGAASCFHPRRDLHLHGEGGYGQQLWQARACRFADTRCTRDTASGIVSWPPAIWRHNHDLWRFPVHTAGDAQRNTHHPTILRNPDACRDAWVFLAYASFSCLFLKKTYNELHWNNKRR